MYRTITETLSRHSSLAFSLGNLPVPAESSPSHVQVKTIEHHSSIPLSHEEEMFIHNRIEVLLQQSANERIVNLIMAMQSDETLSAPNKEAIDKWIRQFFEIDPTDIEALSLSIAYLIIKVLDPALKNEEENEQFLIMEWRENCEELLPLFLRCESVDYFLKECECSLIIENLLKNICLRADETLKILSQAFEQILETNSQKIHDGYQLIKQKLISVQEIRQKDYRTVVLQTTLLIQEIEELAQSILTSDFENAMSLCRQLSVIEIKFIQELEEYESFIKGVYERQ